VFAACFGRDSILNLIPILKIQDKEGLGEVKTRDEDGVHPYRLLHDPRLHGLTLFGYSHNIISK
jgi:hypothetical protein